MYLLLLKLNSSVHIQIVTKTCTVVTGLLSVDPSEQQDYKR